MKKFILAIILGIAITASAFAANSDDIYVRKDVFDVHMQNINQNLEKILSELQAQRNDINDLKKAVAVLSERTDRNFEILSARIDGVNHSLSNRIDGVNHSLSNRIDGVNSRIDDLRNGLYLWLVVIGTFISFITLFIAWPRVKDFLTAQKNTLTIQDVERIIDAKLNSKSQ